MSKHILNAVRNMLPGNLGRPLPIGVKWDNDRRCVVVDGLTTEEALAFRRRRQQFLVSALPSLDSDSDMMLVQLKDGRPEFACESCGGEEFEAEEHDTYRCRLHNGHVEKISGPRDHYIVCRCIECRTRRLV